jgi:putative addiction module CopG family antidote
MALTINLPDHIRAYIEKQIQEGRFESEEAVIASAVEHLMDEYRWEEDKDLLDAIAEYERDGGILVKDIGAYFDDVTRRASEALARGEEVDDAVKY